MNGASPRPVLPTLAREAMLARRLVQLYLGLAAYGVAMALLVRADLGLNPWDVFHQGLAERTGLSFGTVLILVGVAALLLWIPLRQRPGVGTISNLFVIGLVADAALAMFPTVDSLVLRWALLAFGTVLIAAAGAPTSHPT